MIWPVGHYLSTLINLSHPPLNMPASVFPKLHPVILLGLLKKEKEKKLQGHTDLGNAIHTHSIFLLKIHNVKGKRLRVGQFPLFLLQAAQAQALPDPSGDNSETYQHVLYLLPATQPSPFVKGTICKV